MFDWIRHHIADPVLYYSHVWRADDALADVTTGAIRQAVESRDYAAILRSQDAEREATRKVRAESKKFGLDVESVTFRSFGRMTWMCFSGIPALLAQADS